MATLRLLGYKVPLMCKQCSPKKSASTECTGPIPNCEQPVQELLDYVDRIISTTNHAVISDRSNNADATLPKTNPHTCSNLYFEVVDL